MTPVYRGIGRRLSATLLFCLIGLGAHAQQDTTVAARDFVVRLNAEIIPLLATEPTESARNEGVASLLRQALDLELMGRTTLGDNWQHATPEQRAQFQELFADFVVLTYARRLGQHRIRSFSILSDDLLPGGDTIIVESVERVDRPPLQLGFRVRMTDDEAKIIDVSSDGISLVLTQRSDFAAFVKRNGIDALIDGLGKKLAKLNGPL